MIDEDRLYIQGGEFDARAIIVAAAEGWPSFDLASLGASVLMFGIAVGIVIWLLEIRSLASHQ
ncbi:hypothetical protein J2W51_001550 [Tardiphaga robiniae]|uniref:hypothetical protein n=1 Tax=Tardiphaga robiniae TaxID=943830 RepID=UPI0028546D6D|nr:hypothetical protein [Tardiphaga robiniae]MDR6659008.1 hypothetical protein [Tardiphaga robiniae]